MKKQSYKDLRDLPKKEQKLIGKNQKMMKMNVSEEKNY